MIKKLAFILLFLVVNLAASAQVVTPLGQQIIKGQTAAVAKYKVGAAISLPFFDDFATVTTTPDPNRWLNGGVYINHTYPVAPPSKNVASFDGLNQNGTPYTLATNVPGPSDTLTSQPLLLGNLSPADSVYLSFYWQAGGLGDVPDRSTNNQVFILLEFKDIAGRWVPVWQQNGTGVATPFAQVFVGIKAATFLHNDFQFRFRSVGRRNGLTDVWNIDYIELDRNRQKNQNTIRDVSVSQPVSNLLKDYTAMPLKQFKANPAIYLAEQVRITANNNSALPAAISWRGFIKNNDAAVADTFLREQGLLPQAALQYAISGAPRVSNLTLNEPSAVLVHGFLLDTRERNALLNANDTTLRKTEFADYFAYDDGTAEAGFSFPGEGNVQVAQLYEVSEQDQVSAFRVYFPRVGQNLTGTILTLRIWADENGVPGRQLYQQNFDIRHSANLNEFYEVALATPAPVNGRFYVGWSQPGNFYVNIGLDLNEQMPDRRFLFTSRTGWVADNTVKGALMLRPVMTGQQGPLGVKEDEEAARFVVYPNPTSGFIYFKEPYQQLRIFDSLGKEVYFQVSEGAGQPINLTKLSPGLYTLRIETSTSVITKKIIRN